MFKQSALKQKLINSLKLKNEDTAGWCFNLYIKNGGTLEELCSTQEDMFFFLKDNEKTPYQIANNQIVREQLKAYASQKKLSEHVENDPKPVITPSQISFFDTLPGPRHFSKVVSEGVSALFPCCTSKP